MQQFGRSKTVNKELPVGSRPAHQKWLDHCHEIHRQRLQTVRPMVDNKWGGKAGDKKQTYPHLNNNAKKALAQGDKLAERELENYILLAKLSKILQREPSNTHHQRGVRPSSAKQPVYSVHSTAREAELRRIHQENLAIVQRIQSGRPHIRVQEMEKDYAQSVKYKEMISSFNRQRGGSGPAQLDGSLTARRASRPGSAYSSSAGVPHVRPSSAPIGSRRARQLDVSEYKTALHDRRARGAAGRHDLPPVPPAWGEEPADATGRRGAADAYGYDALAAERESERQPPAPGAEDGRDAPPAADGGSAAGEGAGLEAAEHEPLPESPVYR